MKKLIDYPDSIQRELMVLSAKQGKSVNEYIKDLLINTVRIEKLKELQ